MRPLHRSGQTVDAVWIITYPWRTLTREAAVPAITTHTIPGKWTQTYDPTARAVIDTLTTYSVTLDEFKTAVMDVGVAKARAVGAYAWIVDSSKASGAFSQDIQNYIGKEVFSTFQRIGIRYFLTVTSQSALTNMAIASFSAKAGPNGLQVVEAPSAQKAIEWVIANTGK